MINIMSRWILILLILSSSLLLAESRRTKEVLQEEEAVQEQKATVLETDHFMSQTEKTYTFDFEEIDKNKPILFLLQKANEQQSDALFEENPLTVAITAGSDHKECTINHLYGLCTLPKTNVEKAQIKIQCKKTPCEAKWKVEQPQTIEIDGNHTLNHLVSVNEQKNHAILSVFCTDPEIRTQLDSKIEMFTNSKYHKVVSDEGEVFYLFDNEQKGEYFIATGDKAIEDCAVANLEHSQDQIKLSKEGQQITDFFISGKANIYELGKDMETDLRIEVLLHDALMEKIKNNTQITVFLIGINGKNETTLRHLDFDVDDQKEFTDFNLIFKKPTVKYQRYELRMQSYAEHYLIGVMRFIASDLHEVEFGEESYFDLKKGEKINYKLIPMDKEETNIQKINMGLSNFKVFTLSKDSCERSGCEFTVEATEDGLGAVYVGEDVKKQKATEIVQQEFDKSIGGKIREGEQKFYLYKLKANNAIQMIVNSPNVIVYVANKAVCHGEQLAQCHEKQINYHNPSIYESKQAIDLVFLVRALDNAQFVLSIVDAHQPYIQLKDTEPFVYLMDSNEEHIILNFKIPQKEDVSFNLMAPYKELTMVILNKQGVDNLNTKEQAEEGEFSADGSITYTKAELKSTNFIIVVSKREQYKNKFVHFTLIASTKESNLILQPSNPHYEKIPSKSTRDYVFSVFPDKKLFVNFHVQNDQHPNLVFKVSDVDEYNNKSNTVEFPIKKQIDVINLYSIAERLCKTQESECELFGRLTNEQGTDVEVTITLMLQNSIIQLKDGIWQNYDLNEAASSTNFYFLPKHEKHSTTIFYHSTLVDLKVAYTLWKSDDTSIDISQWPFPTDFSKSQSKDSAMVFKPPQFIHIGTAEMKACWPKCVVLISIMPDKKELQKLDQSPTPLFNINHSFKIMASNNLIQVPQKHKMDIVLNKDQEKFLLVDIKDYLQRESIVFFTYSTIGSTILKANVYTQADPRCPTMEEFGADFNFIGIQTEIYLESIKKKLEQNKMNEDHNPYLCILAHGFTQSKFAIQYIPEGKDIKALQLDTTTSVVIPANQVRFFQIHAQTQFYLKLSRTSGLPYIAKKLCNPVNDMEACLDQFANGNEKGEQFVNKVMSLTETPCSNCMLYLKITTSELTQISIHAQSKLAQIQLKSNTAMTDMLAPNQVNKYLITGLPEKQLLINIQIISGDLKVQLNDLGSMSITKENKKGTNNIHISVPSKQMKTDKPPLFTLLSAFLFSSSFVHLHLAVQSQDPKVPASYIVSYSNGEVQTYLQDGLISHYSLMPKKTSKFLYNNPSSNAIYLHLSTADAQTLNKMKVSIYSQQNPNDQDSQTEISVNKEDFKKKTVNPTMLMHLPPKAHYIIVIENQNSKEVLFYIGVNNREMIFLPVDHEFPFRVQSKEYIYFVVSAAGPGYLRFTLNKCDSSQPYLSFTDDYNDFVSENFETQEQIADTLIYDNVIKVKKAGSLYFKVRAEDTAPSILTVKASFSTSKISLNNAKAGNKGNLQYQFADSQTAQISYSGVVCDKNCGDFSYSAIKSTNISGIIAQLVCTSVSFDLLGFTQFRQPQVVPIKATTTKDNKLTFNLAIKEDINYVGVKAVNAKSGAIVYYQPLEITTIRGKISRVMTSASEPQNLSWLIGTIIVISICVLLVAYRRYQKKKQAYSPINYDEMQDAIN